MPRAIASFSAFLLSGVLLADVTPPHSAVMGRDSADNVRLELRTSAGTPYIDFARDETSDYNARIILLPNFLDIYGQGGFVRIYDHLQVAGTLSVGGAASGAPLMVNGVVYSTAGGFRFPDGTLQTTAGVGVPATHGSRHAPDGPDPIATGIPSTIGTNNAAGAANAFARTDHVHAHGNLPGDSLHALATSSAAGFMSNVQKGALDSATSESVLNTLVKRDSANSFEASSINLVPRGDVAPFLEMGGVKFLHHGTEMANNTFVGHYAGRLPGNEGAANTGIGAGALTALTTGNVNVAVGSSALGNTSSGGWNTAVGADSLSRSADGSQNTALGYFTLFNLLTGSSNLAIGYAAGANLTTGSGNILIGNNGVSAESNTIRIGAAPHNDTYIEGIFGQTAASGVNVLVNSSAKLGTTTSSRRFKTDIASLDHASELIARLRPVSFLYRQDLDQTATPQFGLIAEEVAEIDPDLVLFGEDGQPETVRYHFLTPILIRTVQEQKAEIDDLRQRLERLERLLAATP